MLKETETIITKKKSRSLLEFVPRPIIKSAKVIMAMMQYFVWWEEIRKVPIVVSKKRLVKNNNYNLLAMMQSYI